MINYKLENNLIGDENWPRFSGVFVKGISGETEKDVDNNESIIQSWKNVVIMRASSESLIKFYIGYYNQKEISYLRHEFETDLTFAMRVSSEDMNFFVIPTDLKNEIKLELIEVTVEDNIKYDNVILI